MNYKNLQEKTQEKWQWFWWKVSQTYSSIQDIFSLNTKIFSAKPKKATIIYAIQIALLFSWCATSNEYLNQQEMTAKDNFKTTVTWPTVTPEQEAEQRHILKENRLLHLMAAENNFKTQQWKYKPIKEKYGKDDVPWHVYNTISPLWTIPVLDRYTISSREDKNLTNFMKTINNDSTMNYQTRVSVFRIKIDYMLAQLAVTLAGNKIIGWDEPLNIRESKFSGDPERKKFWDYLLHLIQDEVETENCNDARVQMICIMYWVDAKHAPYLYDRYSAIMKDETYEPNKEIVIEDPESSPTIKNK